MAITDFSEEARENRDHANRGFDRALDGGHLEMIKIAIDLCNKAEEKLLIAERLAREKFLRHNLESLESTDLKIAEGRRQYLKNQFYGLTGRKINDR